MQSRFNVTTPGLSDDFEARFSQSPPGSNPPTPLDEEEEDIRRDLQSFPPLTRMEREEEEQGRFGSDPLDVLNGVAVTEEAVELQVPDLITQL